MAAAEAVVVGVRVRPFNDREKALKATVCIDMQGPSTVITNAAGTPQTFSFDQSFWSHDEFEVEPNGYCSPKPGGRYADQRYVFETFGRRVLDNAWTGYHCCLFAYGQTGAGKSYSMVGYGENKGIVPISCEEIFNRVNDNKDANKRYEICLSMVEIYNETVQDLFIPFDSRPKNGFQIRESKALGIYVDGIIKNAVDSYAAIEKAIDQGTSNRSIGSTAMNATSSRAHTVITIEFKQVEKIGSVENVKISNINLIDLAGSEKAGQTGATGDRLKEGSAINKSLSALGNVIEKLAEKSQNPKSKKEILIPYRDSKLTRLLQNALGGSSKTIMICALSPASSNYEETLSTLRYADRAKKIKNAAVVNENPQEKLMREMREENAKLKAMLESGCADGGSGVGGQTPEELREKQEEIARLEQMLQEVQKSHQERLQETKHRLDEGEKRKTLRGNLGVGNPMMVNLNPEMQLTGKIKVEFDEGTAQQPKDHIVCGTMSRAGGGSSSSSNSRSSKSDKSSESSSSDSDGSDDEDEEDRSKSNKVQLSSPGVQAKHAKIVNLSRKCYLSCFGVAAKATWINGVSVEHILEQRQKREEAGEPPCSDEEDADTPNNTILLRHCDRVVFGKAIFLFIDPQQGIFEMITLSGMYSYAKARKELPADWKGTIKEGGGSSNHISKMRNLIRSAWMPDSHQKRNSFDGSVRRRSGQLDDSGSDRGEGGAQKGQRDGANFFSSSDGKGSRDDHGDEASDDASSLGDGATRDEVINLELKNTITHRDRQIAELKAELERARRDVEAKNKEIQRLKHALASGGVALPNQSGEFTGLGDELVRPRFQLTQAGTLEATTTLRSQISTSRQIFNEKANALDETFQEALRALDTTRTGLVKAVSAWEAAKKP